MVAITQSVALIGVSGVIIDVETDAKAGLPGIHIVGMGNKSVDEARERVRSAITNSGLAFPSKKLVINLAPAELPKDGSHFDLAIAVSILVAAGLLRPSEVKGCLFVGELALNGDLRPVRGSLVLAQATKAAGISTLYLPSPNASQASLVNGITVIGVTSLRSLYLHLKQEVLLAPYVRTTSKPPAAPSPPPFIEGHVQAKRALVIAAAGRHNILLSGSPGTGKTLLAKSLASLLPALTPEESIEVTALHSLLDTNEGIVHNTPPFRSPHHTATLTSIIGGGTRLRPGEISLAHKGVLFLDEMPEYPRAILETLRQPLEDRSIAITRHYQKIKLPADFLLVGTMNPCPCGHYGNPRLSCRCSLSEIARYQKRISGPLLDRIDMYITVNSQNINTLSSSTTLHQKQHLTDLAAVRRARSMQKERYSRSDSYNGNISIELLFSQTKLSSEAQKLWQNAVQKMALSTRSSHKVLRVARTIADLESSQSVQAKHIAEALQYRKQEAR